VSGKSLANTSERDGSKKVDVELKIALVSKPLFWELKLVVASLKGENALKVDAGAEETGEATNAVKARANRPLLSSSLRTHMILGTPRLCS